MEAIYVCVHKITKRVYLYGTAEECKERTKQIMELMPDQPVEFRKATREELFDQKRIEMNKPKTFKAIISLTIEAENHIEASKLATDYVNMAERPTGVIEAEYQSTIETTKHE